MEVVSSILGEENMKTPAEMLVCIVASIVITPVFRSALLFQEDLGCETDKDHGIEVATFQKLGQSLDELTRIGGFYAFCF